MRAYNFLIEYNEQSLVKLLGNKVLSKWKAEGSPFKDEINPTYEVTPTDILTWISQYDPTRNGSYVKWLAHLYAKNDGMRKLEDIPSRAQDLLIRYEELKKSRKLTPPDNNINQIKSINQLYDIVNKHKEEKTTSNKQQDKELKNKLYQSGDIEVLYNGPDYLIAIPKTEEASCYLGRNTQWCTAAKNNNVFNIYNNTGDLYVILDKKNNKRWQFHFETRQYMDEQDGLIDIDNFIKTHKKAVNIILKHFGGIEKAAVEDPKIWFKYVKNPSEKVQIVIVKINTYSIKYIRNPSEEVQLTAVIDNVDAMQYIKSPFEAVQLAAVTQVGNAIRYIIEKDIIPSEAVQLAAVKRNGNAIAFLIKNNIIPSEAVQLAAVTQVGNAIRYIIEKDIIPSEAVQLAAVKKGRNSLGYILKAGITPSEAVQRAAVNYY